MKTGPPGACTGGWRLKKTKSTRYGINRVLLCVGFIPGPKEIVSFRILDVVSPFVYRE